MVEERPSINIDETDKKILQILQNDFPIVPQPWSEIANRLGTSPQEVTTRLKRLYQLGAILKIGPISDSSKMGINAGTLVALRVKKQKVDEVAKIINQYANVSHNYEREDEYNIWFTLTAPTEKELNQTLSEIKQRVNIQDNDVLNLTTLRRFKINVIFELSQTSVR